MTLQGEEAEPEEAEPEEASPTLAPVATRLPRPVPRIRPGLATQWSLLAALLVAIAEIDNVLGQIVQGGKAWSPNQLGSPSAIFQNGTAVEGWKFLRTDASDVAANAGRWMVVYGLADVLLVACYVSLVLGPALRGGPTLRKRGARAVVLGGCADLLENLLVIFGLAYSAIPLFTAIKWAGLLLGATLLLLSVRKEIRPSVGHVLGALYTHRYTLLVVLPLAVLGLASGTDILEQVPDIQRAWFPDHVGQMAWAGVILVLVGVSMLYVGRQRTDHLWLRTCDEWTGENHQHRDSEDCPARARQRKDAQQPLLHIWFVGPLVLAVLAGVARFSEGGEVAWGPFALFCVPPVVIGLWSLWLRHKKDGTPTRPIRRPVSVRRYDVTAVVGDVLVGLLTVVAGLGSIRAFTGLAVLDPSMTSIGMVVVGFAALPLGWLIHVWVLDHVKKRTTEFAQEVAARAASNPPESLKSGERSLTALTPGVEVMMLDEANNPVERQGVWDTFKDQRGAWIVLGISTSLLLSTAMAPFPVASRLGVIGTFQLALGSLSVVVAMTVVLLQKGGAPEVLWKIGIPYAPVTTLLVVSALVAGTRSDGVHEIRRYSAEADNATLKVSARPNLDELFQKWVSHDDADGCAVKPEGVDDSPFEVRPLLLYAAEGGGIRATYWTAKVLDRIGAPLNVDGKAVAAICRSAFLSSGASGGSVGLTIASVSPLGSATKWVKKIADPEALAAASDGLVLRDTMFAATGVPLPSLGGAAGDEWADRATLIEQSWEESIPRLEEPFLKDEADWAWKAPGALVLNSTSTTTACRTLISQVDVLSSPGACTSGQEQPKTGAASAANSTDLLACTGQVRSTTAALLTARFPYVTPSGIVTCGDKKIQVVDGGYAENFGVGTLVDLAPQLMHLVRQHNTCVVETTTKPPCNGVAPTTLVAPMLVYFDNGTGSDLAEQPAKLNLEVLVPPVTLLSAKKELYSARSQLARASTLFGTDQLWDPTAAGSAQAEIAVDAVRTSPVAIVFQATKPQIAGPLGWVLSESSMTSMDAALRALEEKGALEDAASPDPLLAHSINDVLAMLPRSEEKAEPPAPVLDEPKPPERKRIPCPRKRR